MCPASRDLRVVCLGLLLAAVAALLIPSFASVADAASPCSRYGDSRPKTLTKEKARNAIICLVNRVRNQHGKRDLHRDDRLQEASRKHSARMAKTGCFSHECRGERSVLGRLQAVNYITGGLSRWSYGENIAWGESSRGTPRDTVRNWMKSPSHRSAMLSGTFRDIGAGFASRGSRAYYTTDFGLRVG